MRVLAIRVIIIFRVLIRIIGVRLTGDSKASLDVTVSPDEGIPAFDQHCSDYRLTLVVLGLVGLVQLDR